MRKAWYVAVTACAALLAGCSSASAPPPAPSGPRVESPFQAQLLAEVSGAGARTHAEALQRIATENGGQRSSGSPGYDASVDYVAGVLRAAGYEVSTPEFTLRRPRGGVTTARNVIAQTRTGSPDSVVLVGAHLDSVPEGPGINDNGSGVAALLELALRMGGSPQVTNAVRFGFWGAEETDMEGSTAYVQGLSAADRAAVMLYLNVDMVASPNAGYFVQGGQGRRASRSGPPGSAEVSRVLLDQLAGTGTTAELTSFDGSSDYAPFVDAGIPSGGVLTGDADRKSAEQAQQWGGRADEVFDVCYHAACDGLDNLDMTALDRFSDAIAGTVGYFALSTEKIAR